MSTIKTDKEAVEWRQRYEKHTSSARWKNMKRDLFRLRGEKCEECARRSPNLELHHLNYKNMGKELPSDLRILCVPCHREADRKRDMETAAKSEARQESAAFETWFEKTSGRDTSNATGYDYEKFQEWRDRKDEEEW